MLFAVLLLALLFLVDDCIDVATTPSTFSPPYQGLSPASKPAPLRLRSEIQRNVVRSMYVINSCREA